MIEQPPYNDDPLDGLLQSWGTHIPGDVSSDLKGRVLQQMTVRPDHRFRTTIITTCGLLVAICLTALRWRADSPDTKLAGEPQTPSTKSSSPVEVQQLIASLEDDLRRTELESRIEQQQAELRELEQLLTNQRLELDRAQLRKQVVSEWLASQPNQ